MAKKAKEPKEKPPERDTGVGRVVKAMLKSKFDKLISACRASASVITDETASIGGMISAAVENDNCHKGAFGWARKMDKLYRQDPAKASEWLFHFDSYRKHADWGDVKDMLPDRQNGGDVAEAEADAEDDDKRDLRPAHLRQPGASAAGDEDDGRPKGSQPH